MTTTRKTTRLQQELEQSSQKSQFELKKMWQNGLTAIATAAIIVA
jgi:hypothetical protein